MEDISQRVGCSYRQAGRQINIIGDNIASSKKELQQSLTNLMAALQGLLIPRDNVKGPVIRQVMNLWRKQHEAADSKEEESKEEPSQDSHQEEDQMEGIERPTGRENDTDVPPQTEQCSLESLLNAQSKFSSQKEQERKQSQTGTNNHYPSTQTGSGAHQ